MARPAKLDEPTKQYKLLMTVKQYDVLDRHAKMLQKTSREQISVADVIRESIDIYIDAIEETNGDSSNVGLVANNSVR
tara:strand:+ start:413 stop:646 length:234 start_codon:yes stop_codon:yes gene_type:complete